MQVKELELLHEYTKVILAHREFVFKAGVLLGVPKKLLEIHDDSKFSAAEMLPYARKFTEPRLTKKPPGEDVEEAFRLAVLHHYHNNPHHWQHWIFPGGYCSADESTNNECVPMPKVYLLEMVADWMGASMAHTGKFDMAEWLENNLHKVKLHPDSKKILMDILLGEGYEMKYVLNLGGGRNATSCI